jgi:hypothetical protein
MVFCVDFAFASLHVEKKTKIKLLRFSILSLSLSFFFFRPLDGESLLPLIQGDPTWKRSGPLMFQLQQQMALITPDGQYKVWRIK